jgi:hypothetical protein
MNNHTIAELVMVLAVGSLCFWDYKTRGKRKAELKAAHEAERERQYGKIKDFPELAKEIYQSIEDQEARFRGEKKKVIVQKQVVVQGQPDEASQQTPLQLLKAAFLSIFK